jgi:hypothetical protein
MLTVCGLPLLQGTVTASVPQLGRNIKMNFSRSGAELVTDSFCSTLAGAGAGLFSAGCSAGAEVV